MPPEIFSFLQTQVNLQTLALHQNISTQELNGRQNNIFDALMSEYTAQNNTQSGQPEILNPNPENTQPILTFSTGSVKALSVRTVNFTPEQPQNTQTEITGTWKNIFSDTKRVNDTPSKRNESVVTVSDFDEGVVADESRVDFETDESNMPVSRETVIFRNDDGKTETASQFNTAENFNPPENNKPERDTSKVITPKSELPENEPLRVEQSKPELPTPETTAEDSPEPVPSKSEAVNPDPLNPESRQTKDSADTETEGHYPVKPETPEIEPSKPESPQPKITAEDAPKTDSPKPDSPENLPVSHESIPEEISGSDDGDTTQAVKRAPQKDSEPSAPETPESQKVLTEPDLPHATKRTAPVFRGNTHKSEADTDENTVDEAVTAAESSPEARKFNAPEFTVTETPKPVNPSEAPEILRPSREFETPEVNTPSHSNEKNTDVKTEKHSDIPESPEPSREINADNLIMAGFAQVQQTANDSPSYEINAAIPDAAKTNRIPRKSQAVSHETDIDVDVQPDTPEARSAVTNRSAVPSGINRENPEPEITSANSNLTDSSADNDSDFQGTFTKQSASPQRTSRANDNRTERSAPGRIEAHNDFQSFIDNVTRTKRSASRANTQPLSLRTGTYDSSGVQSQARTMRNGIVNVVRFIRSEGVHKANIVIDPPALGRISVELSSGTSGVEASVKVASEQIRQIVQNQIIQLRDNLLQQGVQVSEFTVDVQQDNTGQGRNNGQDAEQRSSYSFTGSEDDNDTEDFRIDLEEGLLYWVA